MIDIISSFFALITVVITAGVALLVCIFLFLFIIFGIPNIIEDYRISRKSKK